MSLLSLSITALGHQGPVRQKNDDHYLCGPFVDQENLIHVNLPLNSHSVQQYGFICAVADGMGGYSGGEEASRIVLETLGAFFYSQPRENLDIASIQDAMEEGFNHARTALAGYLRRNPQFSEAGTTLAGLLILGNGDAMTFHVGDSRVLRWNAGFARALTIDHTPIAFDIQSGVLTEEEAALSPQAGHLTRSFGLSSTSEVEWSAPFALAGGDLFLLCTDGWHGLGRGLNRQTIESILESFQGDDCALAQRLINEALEQDGRDNMTLVLLRVLTEVRSN